MKQRILVVDDDPGYRELLKAWLESEGHEAILAETLEEGFVGIATVPLPDVVLLDIHLGEGKWPHARPLGTQAKAPRAHANRRGHWLSFL
jgi:DNA-binding response OmpR family regulator